MPIAPPRRRSVLGPLHEPLFRTLWIAAVVSYTGTWMQNVGAGWLMTSLTMSPLMVGLVQAAGSIAVFLVVLPAGAIADVVDRRKLLLVTQTWMVVAAAGLGVLTIAGKVTPSLLLLFTLLMGFGAVLNDPAWQAITPEIVSHQNFAAGIALNGCRLLPRAGRGRGRVVDPRAVDPVRVPRFVERGGDAHARGDQRSRPASRWGQPAVRRSRRCRTVGYPGVVIAVLVVCCVKLATLALETLPDVTAAIQEGSNWRPQHDDRDPGHRDPSCSCC